MSSIVNCRIWSGKLVLTVLCTLCCCVPCRTKIFIRFPQTLFDIEDKYQLRKHELGMVGVVVVLVVVVVVVCVQHVCVYVILE